MYVCWEGVGGGNYGEGGVVSMGAMITVCVCVCGPPPTCHPATVDALWNRSRTSQTQFLSLWVSPHSGCRVRVRVLPPLQAGGSTKFKVRRRGPYLSWWASLHPGGDAGCA